MATSKKPGSSGNDFDQDPWVDRLRPDPSAPPSDVIVLEGLAGRSNRAGYARLYFNTALNYYVEFNRDDVLHTEPIPADQAPFLGQKATRVAIRQDALVEYTRTSRGRAQDVLDLDVRTEFAPSALPAQPQTDNVDCPGTIGIECPTQPFGCASDQTCGCPTGRTQCHCPTDNTCRTDCGATCETCRTQCDAATCATCRTCQTRCGQATCQTCNQATCHTCQTCQTQCGQATCNTCQTQCHQATCQTCRTDCAGRTCVTCDTCNPHVFTCGSQRQCRF